MLVDAGSDRGARWSLRTVSEAFEMPKPVSADCYGQRGAIQELAAKASRGFAQQWVHRRALYRAGVEFPEAL